MTTVILVIHLLIAIALVGVVLLQKSEGGALGMGGGGGGGAGGGMGGFLSGREKANLLTRTTGVLAALFMVTSISLAILSGATGERKSVLDAPTSAPSAPAEPAKPAAPLAN